MMHTPNRPIDRETLTARGTAHTPGELRRMRLGYLADRISSMVPALDGKKLRTPSIPSDVDDGERFSFSFKLSMQFSFF